MKKTKITRIADMRNFGLGAEKNLALAGIHTPEELRAMGAVTAYKALKFFVGAHVTLNFLWGKGRSLIRTGAT